MPVMAQLSEVPGEKKVVMANRAGRLLRTVKLLLAREKSYDLSSAEGRKGGRRWSKTSSASRWRESCDSLGSGSVLKAEVRRKLENLELELREAEVVTTSPSQLDNLTEGTSERVISPNTARHQATTSKKRTSHKREAPQPKGFTEKKSKETEKEDNCIMCLKERKEISDRNDSRLTAASSQLQQRNSVNKKMVNDTRIQRSKSDAQDKAIDDLSTDFQGLKSKNSSISSKLIKRSMSFNRIFSYSMLNRSKEYRL